LGGGKGRKNRALGKRARKNNRPGVLETKESGGTTGGVATSAVKKTKKKKRTVKGERYTNKIYLRAKKKKLFERRSNPTFKYSKKGGIQASTKAAGGCRQAKVAEIMRSPLKNAPAEE